MNTPVQGGAAECLLAALAELQLDSLNARLVNIVHDELVVECEPEQAGAISTEVERAMVAGFWQSSRTAQSVTWWKRIAAQTGQAPRASADPVNGLFEPQWQSSAGTETSV